MKYICNYYIRNYGSVLQSVALYKILYKISKSYNEKVETIKYIPSESIRAKIEIDFRIRIKYLFDAKMIKKKLSTFYTKKNTLSENQVRYEKFDDFLQHHMTFTRQYNNIEEILIDLKEGETIILGSDQLWGPEDIIKNYHTLNWYSGRKVSYATSFGVSQVPHYLHNRISNYLNKFAKISVRESTGVKIIKELTDRDAVLVCDPTLLLSKNEWDAVLKKGKLINEPYIFCFFLGNNPKQREAALALKNKTGYKITAILHLDEYIESDNKYADYTFNSASPDDFVGLIENAEYVLCDSFHATVFSVLYHKKFLVFDRYLEGTAGSRNSRIDSICRKLNLEDRRAQVEDDIVIKMQNNIKWDAVDECLNLWRTDSVAYLNAAVTGGNT